MADFNQASVQAVLDGLHSIAGRLGQFSRVINHEPKSAPGDGLSLALWWDSITPLSGISGQNAVSARVAFRAVAYQAMTFKDEDKIDPHLLGGVLAFLAAVSESFTVGGIAIEVDLLGAYGEPLSAKASYTLIDSKWYRTADIAVPVIIDSAWTEAP